MDARVVFVSRSEDAVAVFDLFDGARRAFHKLCVALLVIKVNESEGFVRQHHGRAAVDDVMDQHLALSDAIPKRLDLVCGAQCDVVICEPNAGGLAFLQFVQKAGDVEPRADVEVRLVEREIEFEHPAPWPGR